MKATPLPFVFAALFVSVFSCLSGTQVLGKDGDVIKRKAFPGGGVAKLKVGPENARIEVEYELDDVRPRRLYRLVLRKNGRVILNQRKRSSAVGKVRFRRLTSNAPGRDVIASRSNQIGRGGSCLISIVYRM